MKSKFKNISSFILSKRLLFIFAALLMCSGEMWGGDYQAEVTAKPSPTAAGLVYVNPSGKDEEGEYSTSSTGGGACDSRKGEVTVYIFTQPTKGLEDISIFKNWTMTSGNGSFTDANLQKTTVKVNAGYYKYWIETPEYSIQANYEAHCRLYANIYPTTPGGGYVYVTDVTQQKDEAFVKNKGLTSDYADRTAKTTFTASAAPANGYRFKGWAENSPSYGSYVSTQQLNAEFEIDVLNKRTLYAMFMPYWKFSATAVATLNGVESTVGGTATASVEKSEIEGPESSSKASTTATFTATPADGYAFAGWTKTKGATTIEEGYYSNPYTPTIENEAVGTTLNLTLYAVFYELVDPTGMSVSPTEIELTKDATKQITVTMTPELCYKNITFESSNTAAATVDANGLVTGVKSGKSTITVTAKKKDGTVAFTQPVTVKVMEQIPTPVITVEPDASTDYNTALVTIEAGAGSPTAGLDIRYTTDGTEPTQALSQPYHGQFSLNNGSTVKVRAFCTDWYPSEIVSEVYNKQITSKPTIKISLNSSNQYEVTFSCKDDDVTYYYTTDGTAPTYDKTTGDATGNTTKYTGAFVPTEAECIITVIATHAEWRDSDAATKNYVRASGVQDGIVYLNDYEDHTWTYYSGVDSKVDGGNYNTNYNGILYSPDPRNVKITYQGNGGAVSRDNPNDNTFVYYKTLEKQSGKWLYTTIANPFSKRPTEGTGDNRWRGFNSWIVVSVSGGTIKSSDGNTTYAVNGKIPAETEIQFVPSNNEPAINSTAMEVVLKAEWTQAYRYTSASSSMAGDTYEKNFIVLTSNSSSDVSNKNCTIMMVEPDGSADYRSYSYSGDITVPSGGVTKIEYTQWTTSSTIDAGGKNLYIGRGVTTTRTPDLRGHASSGNNTNQLMKVGSGTYDTFYAISSGGSSVTGQHIVFGTDYDRAKGDNSQMVVSGEFRLLTTSTGSTYRNVSWIEVKSGKFTNTYSSAKSSDYTFYMWYASGDGVGYRKLDIQGGEFYHICGGADSDNETDKVTLDYRISGGTFHGGVFMGAASYPTNGDRCMVITGGKFESWIAGGSDAYSSGSSEGVVKGKSFVYVGGNASVNSSGSTTPLDAGLGGNVFGCGIGVKGSSGKQGTVTNGTNVVVADNAYVERGVYGGGSYGYSSSTSSPSNVYITGGHVEGKIGGVNGTSYDSSVTGGIFGGACKNDANAVNIYMTGGIVESGLYGGCNATGTASSVNMVIAGGQIGTKTNLTAKACGGGYGTDTKVSGNVTMTLGVNDLTDSDGNALSPYFYGNCYGGAALGSVTGNVTMTINKGSSYQEGADNTGGEIFCGGLGQSGNTSYGKVGGTLTTVIEGTDDKPGDGKYAYNHIYGGSHYINQTSTTPSVTVKGCNVSIKKLYGGSKEATIAGTNITVNGGNTIGYLFGGSYKAQVLGDVNLTIGAGAAEHVFGGNDLNYDGSESDYTGATIKSNITGNIIMSIDKNASAATCSMYLGEVYGGGNQADSKSTTIKIGCPGYIGQLYGGARAANIKGSVVLDVNGGTYGAIYGGNNLNGTISGSVTVNVEKKKENCELKVDTIFGGGNIANLNNKDNKVTVNVSGDETKVGNIYGGGNLASVYSTEVNVSGGQVSGNIFGGGRGTKETLTITVPKTGSATGETETRIITKNDTLIKSGGTNVNITGGTLTNVFGGNDAGGTITGALNTKINKNTTSLDINGDVYGGGNEADSNVGQLEITCVDHVGNVYGGAKNANITGNIGLKIGAGDIDNVFGGNNLGGEVSGTITIDVQHAGCNVISIGNLYGAGNLADYTSPTTDCNPVINLNTCGQTTVDWANDGTHCLKVGNIFGGGKGTADTEGEYVGKGKVIGNPQINVKAGEIGNIYGGGNIADVEGNTYVNVIDDATGDNQDIYVTGNIYGGGNEAAVSGETNVQIGPKK